MVINFVLCSLFRTFDFVALSACDAYSSETSLKKVLTLDKAKKTFIFIAMCSLFRTFAPESRAIGRCRGKKTINNHDYAVLSDH